MPDAHKAYRSHSGVLKAVENASGIFDNFGLAQTAPWRPPRLKVLRVAPNNPSKMDFSGQRAAEQLCLYIILIAGALAFGVGWFDASFALMMKVTVFYKVATL